MSEHSVWIEIQSAIKNRWPIRVNIIPGEVMSSWLTRLAEANGVSLQLLCWETWPGRHLLTKDLDRTAPNDVVETLSMKTGFAVPEIQQMTIQSMEGALFEDCSSGSARLPWILPVHLRTDRGNGIQYCSDCLKEGVP